jgi:hypothetical protein
MADCRELVERLFLREPRVNSLATLPVFDSVKLGLDVPIRRTDGRQLEAITYASGDDPQRP